MTKTFHKSFKFLDWKLNKDTQQLSLSYQLENVGKVTEVLAFPKFDHSQLTKHKDAIDKACELIHLMCGVSYYKAGLAQKIEFANYVPSKEMAIFTEKTWRHGLAEMVFENKVDLKGVSTLLNFSKPKKEKFKRVLTPFKSKSLVPIGGGKDSLVTIEELKEKGHDFSLFMVGASKLIKEVADFTGYPIIKISRKIDPKLIAYNKQGAFNGHIPITAIISSIAVLTALLFDFDSIVFSNERSADSANTVNSDGEQVNHQYSKSYEFEKDLSKVVAAEINANLSYFSLQRPHSELAILRKFSQYPQYFPVFSSCNRNFHIDGSKNKNSLWCCNCPKCRFVFLGLAPFIEKKQLLNIFGINMLDDASQKDGFEELLGIKGFKPFECVGEIQESQLAYNLIKNSELWKEDYLIEVFRENCPEISEKSQRQIMQASGKHNIPENLL